MSSCVLIIRCCHCGKPTLGNSEKTSLLLPEKIAEKLKELLPTSRGHRIGGYSEVDDNAQAVGSDGLPKILLLRVDTDEKAGIRCKDNEAAKFSYRESRFRSARFLVRYSILFKTNV